MEDEPYTFSSPIAECPVHREGIYASSALAPTEFQLQPSWTFLRQPVINIGRLDRKLHQISWSQILQYYLRDVTCALFFSKGTICKERNIASETGRSVMLPQE